MAFKNLKDSFYFAHCSQGFYRSVKKAENHRCSMGSECFPVPRVKTRSGVKLKMKQTCSYKHQIQRGILVKQLYMFNAQL